MDCRDIADELPPRACAATRLSASALILAAAVLFLVRLGDRAIVSEEFRWAEVAREMRLSGDYLHPTINGRTYFDKPVVSYWLIVVASLLTGHVDETAARLPAAVAGVVGVGVVMLLARRLFDPRAALYSGSVLATSFGYVFYARRATADIETAVGVLVAVWMFARNDGRPTGGWIVGLWIWMAAVSLTKGLLGFALPTAVFAAHGIWSAIANSQRDPHRFRAILSAVVVNNRWFFNRWTVLAMPLGMLVFLLPFVLSAIQTGDGIGLAMVWRENVQRFFTPHNHTGPPYLYVGVVFVIAAPWSAFLPAALLPPSRPSTAAGDRIARAYFWAVFVFFTASASRRSYYLLPIVPAAAILIGRLLTAGSGELGRWAIRLQSAAWALLGFGTVLAGILLLFPTAMNPTPLDGLSARGWILAAWATASVALAFALFGPGNLRVGVTIFAAFAVFGIGFGAVYPAVESLRTRRDFVGAVKDQIAAGADRLGLFDAEDIVFDLGVLAPNYQSASELETAVRSGQIRWVVTQSRRLAGVSFPTEIILREPAQSWESPDRAANKLVLLSVVVRQEDD